MIEIQGNIFNGKCDAICITTNGIVKKNKEAVMGAGIALEASNRFPELPKILGQKLIELGNKVFLLHEDESYSIVSFPTKNHWKDKSDLKLIKKSILELVKLTQEKGWNKIVLPRPGCGNGGLDWKEVKKYVSYLDDRFFIISDR
jgi:O-acetyl-ADP-ribose deacetylase (regulator of RNase III)